MVVLFKNNKILKFCVFVYINFWFYIKILFCNGEMSLGGNVICLIVISVLNNIVISVVGW